MCGFLFGKVFLDQNYFKGFDNLAHRGPDSSSHLVKNGYFFGHHRLSIVGLNDPPQPMVSLCENFVLLFNGEIYNFIELKKRLRSRGYIFKTEGDTEVVLYMLIEFGKEALNEFNGEWSLVFHNLKANCTWFCRDRFGIKPLYFCTKGPRIIIASEMKGIYHTDEGVSINSSYFEKITKNSYKIESESYTLYNSVQRCRPGYLYIYKNNNIDVFEYYSLSEKLGNPIDESNSCNELDLLLNDSTELRLRTSVPKAVSLSGGMDSSMVYSLAIKRENIGFVNVNYGESEYSEKHYVELLQRHWGGNGLYINANPLAKIDELEKIVYTIEDAYPSFPLPMIELYSQMKSAGFKVSLDGHGVDEMLSGYGQIMSAVGDAFPHIKSMRKISRTYLNTFNEGWSPSQFDILKIIFKEIAKSYLLKDSRRYGNLNSQLLKLTSETVLPVLLRNYDRYSMYAGIESRSIFMDHRVVELMLKLPYKFKINNGYSKWILREIGSSYLPKAILERKTKFGFNAPMHSYLTGELRTYFQDWLISDRFKNNGFVDIELLNEKLDRALVINNIHEAHKNAQQFWLEFNALMLMTSPYLRK